MPYTAPSTVSTGDVMTATNFNNAVNSIVDLRSYQNRYASYRRTAGNVVLTGTSTWSDLTTIGTAGDLTLNATAGDVIEVSLFGFVGSEAVDVSFDVVTVVGSTKTNSLTTAGAVPANWAAFTSSGFYCVASRFEKLAGSITYTTVAGDISTGTVKLRVQYAMASATNRTIYASAAQPFVWWAKNLGPVTT